MALLAKAWLWWRLEPIVEAESIEIDLYKNTKTIGSYGFGIYQKIQTSIKLFANIFRATGRTKTIV